MRRILGACGLLLVAVLLVTQRPLDSRAIGGLNTVTLSPGHGKAAAPFQVTYAISPCTSAAGVAIEFSWNALPPAGQLLGTATTDSACRASLSTTPPVNAATHQPPAPGSYQVFGYVALPTGTPAPNTEASARYTVDVTPAPSATTSPSTKASATSKPAASASDSTAASTSASAPAASDFPGATVTTQSGAANPAASRPGRQPGWWQLPWPVILGASLLAFAILTGSAFFFVGVLRRRRASAAAGVGSDKAA